MQWGIRLFLVLVTLGIVGIAVLAIGVIVRPVVSEALRSRSAGNWWLPFLPDAAGGYGPLADNHWWSAMRSDTEGSTAGLTIRWGFWVPDERLAHLRDGVPRRRLGPPAQPLLVTPPLTLPELGAQVAAPATT